MAGHGFIMHPPAGLPTCSMIHFSHVEKTGGTTIRDWLSAVQGILGYGFLSSYNPGYDLPSMPGRDEYRDPNTGLSRTPLGRTRRKKERFGTRLTERWADELASLPRGAPVPAERAWRVAREYHDEDHWHWSKLTANITFYRSLAAAHGCYTPHVALFREPHAYYVSHHVFMTGHYYATVDRHDPNTRADALPHTLSMEQYVRSRPDHQARWLTGKLGSKRPLTAEFVANFVKQKLDVLGTTERMGDFVRATCQAAGLPAGLCLTRFSHARRSDKVCFRGLRNALLQEDTRVLGPSGPLATMREVRRLCKEPRSLYRRIAGSEAMAAAVRQWAPRDLELFAMARAATAQWRASAPPEWLAPALGGDALPVRYRWALHPPGADVKSNASILRVGRWCDRLHTGEPYPFNIKHLRPENGNDTCVLLQASE